MPIVMPENMDFSDKKFTMIISGNPGIGKTTMALSAPNPVIFDFDRGISRVRAQHRKATVVCNTYEEALGDLASPEIKAFDTIIIDTGGSFVTFLQDWAKRINPLNRTKGGALSQQGFGAVKAEFQRFMNLIQCTLNKNVILIFHITEQKDDSTVKTRLLCEGSVKDIVWQSCDIGCFLHMNGNDRVAGFTQTETYFAKGCYGVSGIYRLPALTEKTENNFVTALFQAMKDSVAGESTVWEESRQKYDKAMDWGRCANTQNIGGCYE